MQAVRAAELVPGAEWWDAAEPAPAEACALAVQCAEEAAFTWVRAEDSDGLSHALAWTLAHSLWVGASAAILLAGFLRLAPARRARLRYAASLAALASVPLAAALTLARELLARPEAVPLFLPTGADLEPSGPGGLAVLSAWAGAARASLGTLLAPIEGWIAGTWIVLAALALLRVAGGWARLAVGARELSRAHPRLQARLARLARGLGVRRRVGLYWSRSADVPMVVGILRPRVVVPARLTAPALRGELDLVLRHELAHVRRKDGWFRAAEALLQALFVVHPCVPWIAARAAREREHCCDDLALEGGADRVVYLKSLAALESQRVARCAQRERPLLRRFAVAGALHATDGELLERVRRLATRAPRPRRARVACACGGVVLGCAGLALGALPARDAPPRILALGRAALPAEFPLDADLLFTGGPEAGFADQGPAARVAGAFVVRARSDEGEGEGAQLRILVGRDFDAALGARERAPSGIVVETELDFVRAYPARAGGPRRALSLRAIKTVR